MAGEELLTLDELEDYLDLDTTEEALEPIRKQAIDLFERDTNRVGRPFQGKQSGRVEVKSGTGDCVLWLDYAPETLTSITLGRSSPFDEEIDLSDPDVVSWKAGDRKVVRVDGGSFGCYGSPNYVTVTYDTLDDRPADAALAVKRRAAALWRESGTAEARVGRESDETTDMPLVGDADPTWEAAVAHHRAMAL